MHSNRYGKNLNSRRSRWPFEGANITEKFSPMPPTASAKLLLAQQFLPWDHTRAFSSQVASPDDSENAENKR